MKTWYRIAAAVDDPTIVDLYIIDFIGDWIDDYWGFGVTAKAFVDQISKLPEAVRTIRVHINSPGGDVFAAVNIANVLRDQQVSKGRVVETIVDGLAASSASIVMMAGKTVRIADNGMVMVHNPWTIGIGNAAEMRKLADDLDQIRKTMTATYKWHSTLSDDELIALMDAETWMDADEAIANGFATDKIEGLKAAASLDPRAVAKLTIPDKYRERVAALLKPAPEAPTTPAATDVLRLCREGDCLDLAEGLLAANASLEDVQARVADERRKRADVAARGMQIRALCEKAKLPDRAAVYIKSALSIDDVKTDLTGLTAKLDRIEIDGGLPPDQGGRTKAKIDTAAVYAERNRPMTQKE